MAIRDPFQRQREQEQKQKIFTPDDIDGQASEERLDTRKDEVVPPEIDIEDESVEDDEDDQEELTTRS